MTLNNKHLAIGGFILIAAVFVAGVLFAPSGFISAPPAGTTQGVACIQLNTAYDLCDSPNNFWKETEFNSKMPCQNAHDKGAKSCMERGCNCKYIPLD
jgi:hypothetical protein